MSQEQLVSAPNEQPTVGMMPSRGSSNKKALLVAGLTVLASLLIAGQAFTAYSVYKHSEKLGMLERRSERLQEITVRARANRTPMKMAVPMSSLHMMAIDQVESSPKPVEPVTKCQKEAAGVIPVALPFKPKCDALGAYVPEQCFEGVRCWCVNQNGEPVPGTLVEGRANCG